MDCNKEEGEKCLRLGRKFLADGDLDKALRFLQKSSKLYPSAAVDQLISETEARIAGGNKEGSPREEARSRTTPREAPSPTIPRRAEAAPSAEGGSEANYTSEQKVLVDKVLKCTDYYEMLFLSKTCKDIDIKKAYKKLALQLHPDKNQAPRAEDAFKAISQAFACLSDTEKRQAYDRFGFDPDNRQTSPGGGGGGGGGGMRFRRAHNPQGAHFMFDEDEVSPEEIFNMFFFGVPPRGGRARSANSNVFTFQRGFGAQPQQRPQARSAPHQHAHQHRPRAQQDPVQQGGFFTGFLQLLPILLMLGLLLFSSVLREEPLYKLEKTGVYTVQMETRENQFKYFVRQDFNMAHRNKVEEEVDTRWVQYLRDSCYAQMQEKKTLINKARWAGSLRSKLMEEANNFPLSACEHLAEKGLHVPNYSR